MDINFLMAVTEMFIEFSGLAFCDNALTCET